MTGLEIENWIEKTRPNRPKVSVDQAPNRIEFSIRFDLMPIAKPAYWSPVAPLSGIRQFFSRNLVKFTPCLTPPRIYPTSDKAKLKLPFNLADDEFFYFGRRFSAGTWPSSVMEWARGVGHGITSDWGFRRRSPPDLHSLTKDTSSEHKDCDFLQLDTRAAALGMRSYGRSYFCLLNVIFGCVWTEISIQFSTRSLPEPNRIFGLLNLSNSSAHTCLSLCISSVLQFTKHGDPIKCITVLSTYGWTNSLWGAEKKLNCPKACQNNKARV